MLSRLLSSTHGVRFASRSLQATSDLVPCVRLLHAQPRQVDDSRLDSYSLNPRQLQEFILQSEATTSNAAQVAAQKLAFARRAQKMLGMEGDHQEGAWGGVDKEELETLANEDLQSAYGVQRMVDRTFEQEFRDPVGGWKVGATNSAAQKRFQMGKPFYGSIPSSYIHCMSSIRMCDEEEEIYSSSSSSATYKLNLPSTPRMVRGVELEYGLVIGEDIDISKEGTTVEDVLNVVEKVVPCIEICASRLEQPPSAAPWLAPIQVADGAGNFCVLRTEEHHHYRKPHDQLSSEEWQERLHKLFSRPVTLHMDDELCTSTTVLEAVDGGPLQSLQFLIRQLKQEAEYMPERFGQQGGILKKGQIVATGTCSGLVPITKNCEISATFGGLAEFKVAIELH